MWNSKNFYCPGVPCYIDHSIISASRSELKTQIAFFLFTPHSFQSSAGCLLSHLLKPPEHKEEEPRGRTMNPSCELLKLLDWLPYHTWSNSCRTRENNHEGRPTNLQGLLTHLWLAVHKCTTSILQIIRFIFRLLDLAHYLWVVLGNPLCLVNKPEDQDSTCPNLQIRKGEINFCTLKEMTSKKR